MIDKINKQKYYMCIDFKSFFASVECVDLGLDPMQADLVVCDKTRGEGTICLAVSVHLKKQGVRNRCRFFEIPKHLKFDIAQPHMKRYIEVACEIHDILLDYFSEEDIYVYSIDESFIDLTPYLSLYNMTPQKLAGYITDKVMERSKIPASVGVGTNMFLAKISLDILSKKETHQVAYLDEDLFKEKISHHQPITDVWNIGKGIATRLAKYGVYDLAGILSIDKKILEKEFGINYINLVNHAQGKDYACLQEIKNYVPQNHSFSNSQVLFEDYSYYDAIIILKEMVDKNVLELVRKKLVCQRISLQIGYSKDIIPATGGSKKLLIATQSYEYLLKEFLSLFYMHTNKETPIRKISIGLNDVVSDQYQTYTIFTNLEKADKEKNIQQAILEIRNKYGANAILKGINYEKKSTQRKRNKLIGGHNSE